MAGWVARTRPLTGPLSPRGPQPTVHHPKEVNASPPWPDGHIQGGTDVSTDALWVCLQVRHSGASEGTWCIATKSFARSIMIFDTLM
jgi:hypothetical protein